MASESGVKVSQMASNFKKGATSMETFANVGKTILSTIGNVILTTLSIKAVEALFKGLSMAWNGFLD